MFEIIELPEMKDPSLTSRINNYFSGKYIVSIEEKVSIEFFDNTGKMFHEYEVSADAFFDSARHFFRYFDQRLENLQFNISKNRYLQVILEIIYRISQYRKTVSILELGTTVGENYYLLRSSKILRELGVTLDFVGLEVDPRLVAFAQDVFKADTRFKAVVGEISDLSRFRDQSFDLVTSHHVHSYADDLPAAIHEAVRVSRVAVIILAGMTQSDKGVEFSHSTTQTNTRTLFKAPSVKEFLNVVSETDAKIVYQFSRNWGHAMKINEQYIGKIDSHPYWHCFCLSRYPVLK